MTLKNEFRASKVLRGKESICEYTKRGWSIIERRINEDGFPAKKIDGFWESHTDAIDGWYMQQLGYVPQK